MSQCKLLLNIDGSIAKADFTGFIQQGNDGYDSIFCAILGVENNSLVSPYTVSAIFTLPDGSVTQEVGHYAEGSIDGDTYKGWEIGIFQDETKYAGIVYVSIQFMDVSDNTILRTYRTQLTINKTAQNLDITNITLAQYNRLLELFGSESSDLLSKSVRQYIIDESTTFEDIVSITNSKPSVIKLQASYYLVTLHGLYGDYVNSFEIESLDGANRWVSPTHTELPKETTFNNFVSGPAGNSYYKPFLTVNEFESEKLNHLLGRFSSNNTTVEDLLETVSDWYGLSSFNLIPFILTYLGSTYVCSFQDHGGGSGSFEIEAMNGKQRWYGSHVDDLMSMSFSALLTDTYRQDYLTENDTLAIEEYEDNTTVADLWTQNHVSNDDPLINVVSGQFLLKCNSRLYFVYVSKRTTGSPLYIIKIEPVGTPDFYYYARGSVGSLTLAEIFEDSSYQITIATENRVNEFKKRIVITNADAVDENTLEIQGSNDNNGALIRIVGLDGNGEPVTNGYSIDLEASSPSAERHIQLPNESGILATRTYINTYIRTNTIYKETYRETATINELDSQNPIYIELRNAAGNAVLGYYIGHAIDTGTIDGNNEELFEFEFEELYSKKRWAGVVAESVTLASLFTSTYEADYLVDYKKTITASNVATALKAGDIIRIKDNGTGNLIECKVDTWDSANSYWNLLPVGTFVATGINGGVDYLCYPTTLYANSGNLYSVVNCLIDVNNQAIDTSSDEISISLCERIDR